MRKMNKDEKLTAYIKKYGVACGGDWLSMLRIAIKNGNPEVCARIHWDKWDNSRRSSIYQFVTLTNVIKNSCIL